MSINYPNPNVTVYGKPGCVQCNAMKKHLETKNIPFEYKDVTKDELAFKWVDEMGYQAVPVTRIGFKHFYGFDPDAVADALDNLE